MYTVHEKKKKSILEHVFCKAYKYFSQYILHTGSLREISYSGGSTMKMTTFILVPQAVYLLAKTHL